MAATDQGAAGARDGLGSSESGPGRQGAESGCVRVDFSRFLCLLTPNKCMEEDRV